MNSKDLRIGDIVTTRSGIYKEYGFLKVKVIDGDSFINVCVGDKTFEIKPSDICGLKVDDELLKNIGCEYDFKKVEHILVLRGDLRIAIRPQIGSENYIASIIGQYRSPYCKFTYIHTLQHWLWDKFKIEI